MIEILKEMGRAKENQIIARKLVEYHRKEFNAIYKINQRLAQYHQKEYNFWLVKMIEANKHLEQQHRYLKAC